MNITADYVKAPLYIYWDDHDAKIVPRGLSDDWHKAWLAGEAGRHPRSRNSQKNRFMKLGKDSPEMRGRLRGVTTFLAAKEAFIVQQHEDQEDDQEVIEVPTIQPEPEVETPQYTREQIAKMRLTTLAPIAVKMGIDIPDGANAATIKAKVISHLAL